MTEFMHAAQDATNPVEGLRAVATLRQLTDTLEQGQVEAGLRAGMNWAEIGDALGVSRQAVHKKYRHRVPPELATPRTARKATR